jgi:hypothetical protein
MPSSEHHNSKRESRWNRLVEVVEQVCAQLKAAKHPELLLPEGEISSLRPGEMLLVDDGFFHMDPTHGDSRTARAPCLVGLLEEGMGEPVDVRLKALKATRGYLFQPGELHRMARQDELFHQLVYAFYEYELWRLTDESRRYRKSLHEFYAPGTASLLPGPYEADDVDMVGLLLRSKDPCWVRQQLPPGVHHIPGLADTYAVVIAHFRNVTCKHSLAREVSFDYRETTVFVPCFSGLRPGAFSPILFPDNAMAITLGREIYGFPKRFGRTELDLVRRYAELEVEDLLEFWCEWDREEKVEPRDYVDLFVEKILNDRCGADTLGDVAGWFFHRLFTPNRRNTWPPMSVFVRKQLPDVALPCESDIVYEQDALVRVPFDMSDVKDCEILCDFRFERGEHARFLPQSDLILAGRINLDAGFGVRQQLRDNLGTLDHLRLAQRRFERTAQRLVGRGVGGAQLFGELLRDGTGHLLAGCPSRDKKKPCEDEPQPQAAAEPEPQ